MNLRRTVTGSPWEARNGYSRAVRVGGDVEWIVVSGTTAVGEDGRIVGVGDAETQALRCWSIIERALRDLGADRSAVVRSRVFSTDPAAHGEAVGRAHKSFFDEHMPCLTLVGVSALVEREMLVEIEAEAAVAR